MHGNSDIHKRLCKKKLLYSDFWNAELSEGMKQKQKIGFMMILNISGMGAGVVQWNCV